MQATKSLYMLLIALFLSGCSSSDAGGGTDPDNGNPDSDNGSTDFVLSDFNRDYTFLESNSKIKDRNFYWSTLVEGSFSISNLVQNDAELASFLFTAKQRLGNIANQSNATAIQYADALKFSDSERVTISNAVKKAVENNATAFINFSNTHIGPSGAFIHFSEVTNVDRLHQLIVEELLLGINQIIDTYVAGNDPRYPDIDAVSYDVNSSEYKTLLKNLVSDLNANKGQYKLFYEPFLNFALGAMKLNDRDEAGRYFPMQNGENSEAFQNLNNVKWNEFEYSAIVVLGDSPNSAGDAPNISVGGKERADHGVELYNQGKAPIIIFSGGHVWPVHTEFSEAIEMKKYVMDKYNIPENRILVDPHSRHTTTNLRNIGRLFFRYGIPTDKKAIVSTSKTHSEYVASSGYLSKCQREMNHVPLELHERFSDFDIEFTSKIEVLHLDSSDPLDP